MFTKRREQDVIERLLRLSESRGDEEYGIDDLGRYAVRVDYEDLSFDLHLNLWLKSKKIMLIIYLHEDTDSPEVLEFLNSFGLTYVTFKLTPRIDDPTERYIVGFSKEVMLKSRKPHAVTMQVVQLLTAVSRDLSMIKLPD